MATGINKYIDTAFPGLRDKIKGTENAAPISSIPVQSDDAGTQLMGPQKRLRDRSTRGSAPFSAAELKAGYRKVGKK